MYPLVEYHTFNNNVYIDKLHTMMIQVNARECNLLSIYINSYAQSGHLAIAIRFRWRYFGYIVGDDHRNVTTIGVGKCSILHNV